MIQAARIRMDKFTTTHPIVKLYPLEVSDTKVEDHFTSNDSEVTQPTQNHNS